MNEKPAKGLGFGDSFIVAAAVTGFASSLGSSFTFGGPENVNPPNTLFPDETITSTAEVTGVLGFCSGTETPNENTGAGCAACTLKGFPKEFPKETEAARSGFSVGCCAATGTSTVFGFSVPGFGESHAAHTSLLASLLT